MGLISRQDLRVLKQILMMPEQTLLQALGRTLEKYYPEEDVIITNDFIYAVGSIPVALIAHLDTVYKTPPTTIFHDQEEGILWTPQGLGADDRAGVFAILKIIQNGYRPSILFLTKEEIGGKGAFALIEEFVNPISDVNFLIELDRQGIDDAVYYDCGNRDFERYITSFGFATEIGTFSDILIIGPCWDRAAVNLSIGYYNEHSYAEYLNYNYTYETIEKVQNILNSCGDTVFDYQDTGSRMESRKVDGKIKCDACDTFTPEEDILYALNENSGDVWRLCPKCFSIHASICEFCGKAFLNPYRDLPDICTECSEGGLDASGKSNTTPNDG